MPLAGRNADVKVTALTPTSSTNEACTRSTGPGATVTGKVQIDNTTRRHWDPDSIPALYVVAAGSTSLVSSALYDVNYVTGTFQWKSGDPSTGTYTADVSYLTSASVAGGREWQLNVEADMFEVSTFGSSGWKQFQPNLNGASVTIGRYWTDPTFHDYLIADARFVVELIPLNAGSTSDRYEGFARIGQIGTQAAVDSIVGETLNLVVDGALYYTT